MPTVKKKTLPKVPVAKRPNGECFCRCGREAGPGRHFVQGHDKRAETILNGLQEHQRIIDRLVDAGYHFEDGGKNLRSEALASDLGYYPCTVDDCEVYGRGGGMARHVDEHEAGLIDH
ncbi:hypothetical protein [Pimelobacter simplex]|uniref:hypothetical protein n=1 Tax=Nocardioides simplex TaxID=2045 RepID=UPI0021505B6A|nr:hypothetical protein [Pimelobacter simplex]UUW91888.1 hypothetical protein M0M43_10510 [Pimelobacter simplex]UUW95715.1 hypothetical protein M0M48_29005 [Pimelobacter simplex]